MDCDDCGHERQIRLLRILKEWQLYKMDKLPENFLRREYDGGVSFWQSVFESMEIQGDVEELTELLQVVDGDLLPFVYKVCDSGHVFPGSYHRKCGKW